MRRIRPGPWLLSAFAGLLVTFAMLLSGVAQAGTSTDGARFIAQSVHMGEWEHASEGATLVLKYQLRHRTAPDAVPAAILMARSLTQLGRHAEALHLLAPLGSSAAVVAARGTILLEQGDYSEANAAFVLALHDPSALPLPARARVTCEQAFVSEQTGDAAAASTGYLDALKLYAAAAREQTLFVYKPRVTGTFWDEAAPPPRIVSDPVGDVIAELDRLGEPYQDGNYLPESYLSYFQEEVQDSFPRAAPFADCLLRAARHKDAAGEQELAHAIFQTAIAQADFQGYTYRPALAFIAYFEFLERANFDPRRLEKMVSFALMRDIHPAYSMSDIRNPAAPTTSPRMKAYQALNAVRLRALFRTGDMSDEIRDEAFVVAQDYQSSVAALAIHSNTEGRVHPRYAVMTKAQHKAFWAQFDRDKPISNNLAELRLDLRLKPGQLLLMISPGAGTGPGRIWAIGAQGDAWAALGTDRETLRADIETLRCALDAEMCCSFPNNSRMGAAYHRLVEAFKAEFQLDSDSIGTCPLRDEHFEASIAYRVFDEIFADPIIRDMVTKVDELIIVPQGEFASVPFGALPMVRPQAGRGPAAAASAKWLGLEKAISIYPSLNSYVEGDATANDDNHVRLFGVGDPVLGASLAPGRTVDCTQFAHRNRRARGVSAGDPMFALSPLPGTRCELLAIAKLSGVTSSHASRPLLWDRATEGRVRAAASTKGPLSQAEVLVFATHGLMRGDFGLEEPALVLSRPRLKGAAQTDGLLTLSEIMQLHMQARLVILSACNTGSSGEAAGDALASFATAFFRAGAESVLLSQWTVRDDVAAFVTPRIVALMLGEPTIRQCQRGGEGRRSTAEATRMALCEARYSEALGADLPGDWAPFVLVGGRSKL